MGEATDFFCETGSFAAPGDRPDAALAFPFETVDFAALVSPGSFFWTALLCACFGGLTLLGMAGTPFVNGRYRPMFGLVRRGWPNRTADLTTATR